MIMCYKLMEITNLLSAIATNICRVGQKTGPLCFTAYNCRKIEQILY